MTKSEQIKTGLQEKFKAGTTKLADRVCYDYAKAPDGRLIINENEASVIRWIFERYLTGDSLGKITKGLADRDILSPTGKSRWNSEAIHKLLSNEKYIGKVLLQKTLSLCGRQFTNDGYESRYLYENNHPAIISEEMFDEVQEAKQSRSRTHTAGYQAMS